MKRPLRLVVGGGRAATFPALRAEDISLNVARIARPHVLGDIASAPVQAGQFRTVYFERVPFPAFTGSNSSALSEAARILRPGGRIVIETGSAAPRNEIVTLLRTMGFTNIRVTGRNVLRVTAILGEPWL
jgi:ubiquinone/menaquinone biosynthesis C-methylase UbiE